MCTNKHTHILSVLTHSLLINAIIFSVRFDINGCRGQMHFGAAITRAVHFLLARPDSIFSELLWGPWTTTHAAVHPIKIKWSLRDSLSTDKLFSATAHGEKKKVCLLLSLSAYQCCTTGNNNNTISSLIHQEETRSNSMGENMLHWLIIKLLKETICFPCLYLHWAILLCDVNVKVLV